LENGDGASQGHAEIHDGQPMFPDNSLDELMKDLESQLPEVPLCGPDKPQIPSPLGDRSRVGVQPPQPVAGSAGKDAAGGKAVVPTPCRANKSSRSVAPNGVPNSLGGLKD